MNPVQKWDRTGQSERPSVTFGPNYFPFRHFRIHVSFTRSRSQLNPCVTIARFSDVSVFIGLRWCLQDPCHSNTLPSCFATYIYVVTDYRNILVGNKCCNSLSITIYLKLLFIVTLGYVSFHVMKVKDGNIILCAIVFPNVYAIFILNCFGIPIEFCMYVFLCVFFNFRVVIVYCYSLCWN